MTQLKPALVVLVGLAAVFGTMALAQYSPSYVPSATLPLYAGGIAQAQPPAAGGPGGDQPPPWAVKLQEDVSWIRKALEEDGGSAVSKDAPSEKVGAAGAPGALDAALSSCAACHAPDSAQKAGGGHVLFEAAKGGLNYVVPDDPGDWEKAVRLVRLNRMPKIDGKVRVDPLTADQKAAYLALMQENKPTRK